MLKKWFIAMRPWSFTAALIPIALGTVLAWNEGIFNLGLFLLTLLGGICVQTGTNFINTYCDYKNGVDTIESAKTCPQLVTGEIEPKAMKKAGIFAFAVAFTIGLILSFISGWEIMIVGAIGLLGGYYYTGGSNPYKYKGLGPLFVFFLMGPLMAWPAYFIQTGTYSILPIIVSLPIGFLVSNIMHGNDLRDIKDDEKAGIKTLAMKLGIQKSVLLYCALYISAYIALVIAILIGSLEWPAMLPLALLPAVFKAFKDTNEAKNGESDKFNLLEAKAAGFHFQFGLLLVIGIIASSYMG